MSQYATYTKFYAPEDAQFLVTLLQQHAIPYALDHEVNQLDKVYIGETIEAMFALKVPGNRFNEIHALLAEQAKADSAQPGFEHYLQTYSVSELKEFLNDPEGWNAYDIQVAEMLLAEKAGEEVALSVNQPANDAPVKLDNKWIVLGYLACLTGLTDLIFFGAAGFFSGLAITQAKKTLKNGNTVKLYTKQDRNHGRNMMVLSILCMVIAGFIVYNRYY